MIERLPPGENYLAVISHYKWDQEVRGTGPTPEAAVKNAADKVGSGG
jgi:hypothetical protein